MFEILKSRNVWFPFVLSIIILSTFHTLERISFFELDHEKNTNEIQAKISKVKFEFDRALNNKSLKAIDSFDENSIRKLDEFYSKQFYYQVYLDNKLTYWTNNSVELNDINFEKNIDKTHYVADLKNGTYLVLQKRIDERKVVVGMIPIRFNYEIHNRYLDSAFNPNLSNTLDYIVDTKPGKFNIYVSKNNFAFSLVPKDNCNNCNYPILYFLFVFTSLFLFFYSINTFFAGLSVKFPWISFVLLATITFSIRTFLMKTQTPSLLYTKTMLFNPLMYSSSSLNPTLGDFLIFVLWCNWMILFFNRRVSLDFLVVKNKYLKFLIFTIILIFLFGETVSIHKIFEKMILNSTISFDFNFFPKINIYSIIGLASFLLCFANYFILIRKFVRVLSIMYLSNGLMVLASLITMALYYYLLVLKLHAPWQLLTIVGIVASVVIIFFYYYRIQKGNKLFIHIVFLLFSASSTTILLNYYNNIKQDNFLYDISKKLAVDRDLFTENTFTETIEKMDKDVILKVFFKSEGLSFPEFKDHLIVNHLGQYTARFNVDIFTLNEMDKLYKINDSMSFNWMEKYKSQKLFLTEVENLYYFKEKNKLNYILAMPIRYKDEKLGTIIIQFRPKQIMQDNIYPELLLNESELRLENFDNFNFAVYSNNELITQKGSYPRQFKTKNLEGKGMSFFFFNGKKKFKHQIYQFDQNKIVVLSTETTDLLSPVSMFSYVFCFFMLLYALGLFIYNSVSIIRNFKNGNQSDMSVSLRMKINLFITLLVLFFFLIIGVISYNFFNDKYDNYHKEFLINKQKTVYSSLQMFINDLGGSNHPNFLVEHTPELTYFISRLAEANYIDINLFDAKGKLLASSQKSIFEKGLVSGYINPESFKEDLITDSKQKLIYENIGKLNYVSISTPIRGQNNELLGFLNIPYFSKSKNLELDFSSFIVALLNVYVILLILTILLAFLVSNSITKPLKIISNRLTNIDLKGGNLPINYKANDELGDLVFKYNEMVDAVQKSASIMAQSERESAWREMAKQVAHEIKNPLTPMKLSIQYLQKTIQEDPENAIQLAERVSKTLIEQINNLVDIANAFSSFARMTKPESEIINLNGVLSNITDLFKLEPNTHISFNSEVENPLVYFDRNQLVSAFNNIIKNAVQSKKDFQDVVINVSLEKKDAFYLIKIQDNGCGIPIENQKKIFEPNFTTKNSGTGLGMPITKKIIETANGKIYMESKFQIGSIFYIELPIYNDENTI